MAAAEVTDRINQIHATGKLDPDGVRAAVDEFPKAIRLNGDRLEWVAREPERQQFRETVEMAARWFTHPSRSERRPNGYRSIYRTSMGSVQGGRATVMNRVPRVLAKTPDAPHYAL